jgi:hypothetical protein
LRAGPAFETEEDHHEIPSTDIRIHFEEQGYGELTLGFLHYCGGSPRAWRRVIDNGMYFLGGAPRGGPPRGASANARRQIIAEATSSGHLG